MSSVSCPYLNKKPFNCFLCNNQISIKDSRFFIFLDVDGVIKEYPEDDEKKIENKCRELYPYWRRSIGPLERAVAASYLFSEDALSHLEKFILEVEKTHQVAIVLSTSWRESGSLEQLITQVFDRCSFKNKIIGKTPLTKNGRQWMNLAKYDGRNYLKLDGSFINRAAEILFWCYYHGVDINREALIIDDCDLGFSANFPSRFLHTCTPFNGQHLEQALNIINEPSKLSEDQVSKLNETLANVDLT